MPQYDRYGKNNRTTLIASGDQRYNASEIYATQSLLALFRHDANLARPLSACKAGESQPLGPASERYATFCTWKLYIRGRVEFPQEG